MNHLDTIELACDLSGEEVEAICDYLRLEGKIVRGSYSAYNEVYCSREEYCLLEAQVTFARTEQASGLVDSVLSITCDDRNRCESIAERLCTLQSGQRAHIL